MRLPLLFLGLLLASTAAGQNPGTTESRPTSLKATFIGNEAWHITDGEYVLLTDFPYQGGYAGYMTWDWTNVPKAKGSKVLLVITHRHLDHFASYELARLDPGGVIGPALIRTAADKAALQPGSDVRFGPIRVEAISTPHASLEHYSYVIEWSGVRFYLPGDTEETTSLVGARRLDVAFVTPWMLDKARREGSRIDARRVIVVHHTAGESVSPYAGSHIPRQGETIEFGPQARR